MLISCHISRFPSLDNNVTLLPSLVLPNKSLVCATDDDAGAGQFQKEVEDLPPELKHYIQEDNWRLEQEVEEWEGEQSCKIPQIEPSSASESQDFFSESGPGWCDISAAADLVGTVGTACMEQILL